MPVKVAAREFRGICEKPSRVAPFPRVRTSCARDSDDGDDRFFSETHPVPSDTRARLRRGRPVRARADDPMQRGRDRDAARRVASRRGATRRSSLRVIALARRPSSVATCDRSTGARGTRVLGKLRYEQSRYGMSQ